MFYSTRMIMNCVKSVLHISIYIYLKPMCSRECGNEDRPCPGVSASSTCITEPGVCSCCEEQ